MNCNRVAVSYAGRGRRSDLPDGLRQAGTTNDGRDEDSKTMRITTHCHGLYPWLQVHARPSKTTILNISPSSCGSTIGGDSSNITTRLIKIGIQPRHRRLHWRFAAIRRSLHSQKNARHRPQRRNERNMQNEQEYSDGQIPISPFRADTSDNDPFSSEGGGSAVRKTGRLQYGSH